MIEVGEILTLDNNKKYVVGYTTNLDSKNYIYLVNQDNISENMFCEYVDSHLEEVVDPEIIAKLLKQFKDNK